MPEGLKTEAQEIANLLEFYQTRQVPADPLDKAATIVSSKGMFSEINVDGWSSATDAEDVRRRAVLPDRAEERQSDERDHAPGPQGKFRRRCRRRSSCPQRTREAIHFLSGVAAGASRTGKAASR